MNQRTVLVAGGTRGIGLEIAKRFAREGDHIAITHRWGSVSDEELNAEFESLSSNPPLIIEADIANDEDTELVMDAIGKPIDVFVPNVCVAGRGDGHFHARTLRQSLERSAWPVQRYIEAMVEKFGRPPQHVVATSSDGPDHFYPGYDYVAASKSLLEALCVRLQAQYPQSNINALRARQVDTASYRDMFSDDAREQISKFSEFDLDANEVANAAYEMCSDSMAGLKGQVVVVDRGATRMDNLINVAPRLLGMPETISAQETNKNDRVLCVLNNVKRPPELSFGFETQFVDFSELGQISNDDIPAKVVVAIDWDTVSDAQCEEVSSCLVALFERAAAKPRYGVQIDLGHGIGVELSRTLGRYQSGWLVRSDSRINYVSGTEPSVWAIAKSLMSGNLDGVSGQVLESNS